MTERGFCSILLTQRSLELLSKKGLQISETIRHSYITLKSAGTRRVNNFLKKMHERDMEEPFQIVNNANATKFVTYCTQNSYNEHKQLSMYNSLINFTDKSWSQILAIYEKMREYHLMCGMKATYKYELGTCLRSITVSRPQNTSQYSSDTAVREMAFFFPEFDHSKWVEEELQHFQKGTIKLDETGFVHKIHL
ncbi:unnamed protein product, partial [Meganyctiphanes norvegica]